MHCATLRRLCKKYKLSWKRIRKSLKSKQNPELFEKLRQEDEFNENIEKWKELGLTIVQLEPYSLELNLIELLWRKIKYEWMPFSAYDSFTALDDNLYDILAISAKNTPSISAEKC